MEFKVKAVEGTEQKSRQEVEEKLLKEAEAKNAEPVVSEVSNEIKAESLEQNPKDVDSLESTPNESTQSSELKEEDVLSFIKNRYEKDFTSVDQIFDAKNENEELPEDVKSYFYHPA